MEPSQHRRDDSTSWWSRRGTAVRKERQRRFRVEALESRRLLTSITEYSLLPAENNNASSEPLNIAAGPDGNLWFTDLGTSEIGKITPGGRITMYTSGLTANSKPQGITRGPDGNLWFAETNANQIGKINPSTGQITEYATGISAGAQPVSITAGPDGNLWFTEFGTNGIGKITTSGQVTEYTTGITAKSGPWGITAGPNGSLWFTEQSIAKIGQITTSGQVTEYSNGITANSFPTGITAADGKVWFTEYYNGKIGELDPSSGRITQTTVNLPGNVGASLSDITAGPDGNLWVTAMGIGQVAAIDPATLAATVVNTTKSADPQGITAGPDGNLWFTEINLPDQSSGQTLDGGAIGVAIPSTHLMVTAQPSTVVAGGGFDLTADVVYDTGVVDRGFNGNVTVTLANNPGGGTLGGTATVAAVNGVASFTGLSLNNVGNGYTLAVSANGSASTTAGPLDVTAPQSGGGNNGGGNTGGGNGNQPGNTPVPTPVIIAEQISAVHLRHNKRGKPIGKPVVEIVLTYSTAMNPGTVGNVGIYQVASTSTRKVRRKVQTILHPMVVLSASSDQTHTVVTLVTSAPQTKFAKGGQLTIVAPGSILGAAGGALGGGTVFVIAPRARGISPA